MAERETKLHGECICFGPFCLSPAERLLTRNGAPVEIGGRSFDLLVALTEQPGRVFTKRELLKRVWSDVVVEDGSLRFHLAGLRKLLGDGIGGARYIATQVGVGYAFVAPTALREMPAHRAEEERSPTASPTNLPARLTRLIGRERAVELLVERVPGAGLFTIAGAGGIGKTALAIEVGHRLAPSFDNRLAFVDLGKLADAEAVPAALVDALGGTTEAGDPLDMALDGLRDSPRLLILDNCEHLVEAVADLVERIAAAAPGVRIIATSREPLRVRDEHVLRLGGLGFPEAVDGRNRAELLAYPAVELFCIRATAADSGLTLDDHAVRLIAGMCARLDGVALAIETAALRVATHGIAHAAEQLGAPASLDWPGRRTAQPRQQSVRAMLDWSYALLSDAERIMLERLSIFAEGFSISAAIAEVAEGGMDAGQAAARLDDLVAKSLIIPVRSCTSAAYRLREMVRIYSGEKLSVRRAPTQKAAARPQGRPDPALQFDSGVTSGGSWACRALAA